MIGLGSEKNVDVIVYLMVDIDGTDGLKDQI